MYFFSAFLVGFLGSFHCAGMCGPIALALPVQNDRLAAMIMGRLIYNAGRILTYAMLGLCAGAVGHVVSLGGFQQVLSIGSGVLILLFAILSLGQSTFGGVERRLASGTYFLKQKFRKHFSRRTLASLFVIGSLNGLLPCGFVYLALVASAASGSAEGSVGYMMLFGIGTLPMMMAVAMAGNFFGPRFGRRFRQATPYIAMALAVLLISRGFTPAGGHCCHPL